ncbi:hypothetical protein [Micromonospora sp. NPDC003776]
MAAPGRAAPPVCVPSMFWSTKAVLHDHDVQAKAGALTADVITIKHTGGDLKVELRSEIGERDPILNALKVQEDPRP